MHFGLLLQLNAQSFDVVDEKRVFMNSRIEHDSISYQSYSVKEGEFFVFQFISTNSGEPGNSSVAESVIAFQADNALNEFQFKDEELSKHQTLYIQRCRCQDKGIQFVESGEIRGKVLPNGNWQIEGEVKATGNRTGKTYHLSLNDEFKAGEG